MQDFGGMGVCHQCHADSGREGGAEEGYCPCVGGHGHHHISISGQCSTSDSSQHHHVQCSSQCVRRGNLGSGSTDVGVRFVCAGGVGHNHITIIGKNIQAKGGRAVASGSRWHAAMHAGSCREACKRRRAQACIRDQSMKDRRELISLLNAGEMPVELARNFFRGLHAQGFHVPSGLM